METVVVGAVVVAIVAEFLAVFGDRISNSENLVDARLIHGFTPLHPLLLKTRATLSDTTQNHPNLAPRPFLIGGACLAEPVAARITSAAV